MELPTDEQTGQDAAREFEAQYSKHELSLYGIVEPYLQQYAEQGGTGQGKGLNGFDEVLISIQGYSLKSLIQAAHPDESYFDDEGAKQLLERPERIVVGAVHNQFHDSWRDLADTPEFAQLFGAYNRADETKQSAMDRTMQGLIGQTVPQLARSSAAE